MDKLIVLASCIGLTWILKYGEILNPIRSYLCKVHFLKSLFKCSLCLGFWSGVILGSIYFYLFKDPIVIFLPFASSFLSWLFDEFFELLEQNILKLQSKNKSCKNCECDKKS